MAREMGVMQKGGNTIGSGNRRKGGGFLRFLRWVALLFFLVLLAAGGVVWWYKIEWEGKARALDYDRLREMESASVIFDRNGDEVARLFIFNREVVPLKELSPFLLKAVVAKEDARFYQHRGVDLRGVMRAAQKNFVSGAKKEGASTITQQLARNTFREELPPEERTIRRKLLEMFVAWEIERRFNKDEILELYLNRILFGSGLWGAESASQAYFGKTARELSLEEAAMMAGLIRSPGRFSPWSDRQRSTQERNYVLLRMRELGMIGEAEYVGARERDVVVKNRKTARRDSYAADMVAAQMRKLFGTESALSDGYRIHTTLDLRLQRAAEKAMAEQLTVMESRAGYAHPTYSAFEAAFKKSRQRTDEEGKKPVEPDYLQGTFVMLDNRTGAIRAIAGGRDAAHSEFNRVLSSKRQAAGVFTPLVFATGYSHGLNPNWVVQDAPMDNRQVMIGGTMGLLGEWGVERMDNGWEGGLSAHSVLVKGKNAAAVRFGMGIGEDLNQALERVRAKAAEFGVRSSLRNYSSTFLGASEVTAMEMALAYTVFPNGGERPDAPFLVDRIEDRKGRQLYKFVQSRQPVLSGGVSYQVHRSLRDVLTKGTGVDATASLGLKPMEAGGKSGTAYDSTDLWFAGYNSEVTCVVWSGFDRQRRSIGENVFSRSVVLPVWVSMMNAAAEVFPPRAIQDPGGWERHAVCSKSGMMPTPLCHETVVVGDGEEKRMTVVEEWLAPGQKPRDSCEFHGGARARAARGRGGETGVVRATAVGVGDTTGVEAVKLLGVTVEGEDPFRAYQAVEMALAIRAWKDSGLNAPVRNTTQAPEGAPGGEASVKTAPVVVPKAVRVNPVAGEGAVKEAGGVKPVPKLDF